MASFLDHRCILFHGQNCIRLYQVSPLLQMDTNLCLHRVVLPGSVARMLCDLWDRNRSKDEVFEYGS